MTLFQAERSSKPHSEQILGFRFAGGTRHGRVALHCLSQVNSRGSEPRAHHRETHIVADADEWVWTGGFSKSALDDCIGIHPTTRGVSLASTVNHRRERVANVKARVVMVIYTATVVWSSFTQVK